MRKLKGIALLAAASSASVASAEGIVYDGFDYSATGNPPLGIGPNNAAGSFAQWRYQGNNINEPRLFAGSVSYPGLPPSIGNKVQLDNNNGLAGAGANAARLYIGNRDSTNYPTLYYSFVTTIPSSTNASQTGAFFAGFDNLTAAASYTTFAGLFVRQNAGDTTDIDLGISTSGSANRVWTSALPENTPLFVVGSFTFGGASTLDVFVDPTAIPFAEPGVHQVTSSGNDASAVTAISNFYLRGNLTEPDAIEVDEVRIGSSWADVASHAYYWDIDGATPGAGGTAPSGDWDGVATNFNTDSTGSGGGTISASTLAFDSVNFSAANEATGTYNVNVTGTRSALVNVTGGNVSFTGGTLAVGRFDIAAGATATVSSTMSGAPMGVAKAGDGTLTLTGANTWTGDTRVSAGTLVVQGDISTTSSVNITAGTMQLTTGGGNNRVIKTPTLAITGDGKLDITDNKLIVTAGALGTWNGTAYTGITGLIQAGRGDGSWNGTTGIVTSMSEATTSVLTTIAVTTGAIRNGLGPTDTDVFAGQTINGDSTLVMYTWGGDANLDGTINGDDYFAIDSNILAQVPGYHNGDFDYNGEINGDDYFIIDANITAAQASAPFYTAGGEGGGGTVGLAAVPEPGSIGMLGMAACGLLRRRRRH
jgi:autotransporter-associated beta strand protein